MDFRLQCARRKLCRSNVTQHSLSPTSPYFPPADTHTKSDNVIWGSKSPWVFPPVNEYILFRFDSPKGEVFRGHPGESKAKAKE